MKILHMVHSRSYAGTERHILGVARELRQLGHQVSIACPQGALAEPMRQAVRAAQFELVDEWAVRRHRAVEVIHSHDGSSTLAATSASVGRPAISVRTQHFVATASSDRAGGVRELSQLAHRVLNARLDGYICVSQAAARAAVTRGEVTGTVTVIPPGIVVPDEAWWQHSIAQRESRADPVIVSAGRIDRERSFETLISALPQVQRSHPGVTVIIAGAGEATAELQALAESLGVAAAVSWPGWVPDLQAVLAGAHLYVNTWPEEGFGMATAEAMAAGVPVIVPATGAAPELVADGIGGWIVPPRDPDALAAQICEVLSARDRLAATGGQGRERAAREYSVGAATAEMVSLYETLLGAV
jgi:glycosyltransferase involved in cell wall biosynthesis